MGPGEVSDKIHGDLLEGVRAFGGNGGKGGVGWVHIDLIGLASCTASNEFTDEGGHTRPPIVFLEERDGVEVAAVSACKGLMNVLHEGGMGRLADIEA